MNEGWKCPVCSRGVAPTEKHCDHGGLGALQPLPCVSYLPSHPVPPGFPGEINPYPITTYRVGSSGSQTLASIPHNGGVQ